MIRLASIVAGTFLATAALAHEGVKNPTVKARMDLMSAIAEDMKVLGGMVKGEIDFDQNEANASLSSLASHAERIAPSFEEEVIGPVSEARPEVWTAFDDFIAIADEMQESASIEIAAADDLTPAFRSLAATCSSCHEDFRQKR